MLVIGFVFVLLAALAQPTNGPTMLAGVAQAQAIDPLGEADGVAISRVRFGIRGDQTRMVIEVNRQIVFTTRMEEDGRLLTIDMPPAGWRLADDGRGQPRGLVASYHAQITAFGQRRIEVRLTEPAVVADQFILPPADGHRVFRVVVDLESAGVSSAPIADAEPPGANEPTAPTPDDAAQAEEVPATPTASAPMVPVPPVRPPDALPKRMIVLDPGHGGIDPGAIGVDGSYEKDIVLAMARTLRDKLLDTGRYDVVLTRETDETVHLYRRIQVARANEGSLFISIHADSLEDGDLRGASVYTISETASDKEAERLASKENRAHIVAGADLSDQDPLVASILVDLAFRDTTNKSISFADALVDELGDVTVLLRSNRRFAGFVVLKSPDVPSVLLELGYLSNEDDVRALNDEAHRRKVASAIVRAIDNFFKSGD